MAGHAPPEAIVLYPAWLVNAKAGAWDRPAWTLAALGLKPGPQQCQEACQGAQNASHGPEPQSAAFVERIRSRTQYDVGKKDAGHEGR